jgi:hypothetical protein
LAYASLFLCPKICSDNRDYSIGAKRMSDNNKKEENVGDKKGKPQTGQALSLGIGIGVAIGSGVGIAINNIAVGISVGIALGVAFGMSSGTNKHKQDK